MLVRRPGRFFVILKYKSYYLVSKEIRLTLFQNFVDPCKGYHMKNIKIIITLLVSITCVLAQPLVNIAILELEGKNVSQTEASILSDKLRVELYKTEKFNIIERGQMDEILEEQGFQQTGCFSDECIVEVGRLIGVEQIIAGSIGKVGDIYFISIRLISVSQGTIINNVEEMVEGSINEVLKTGMTNITLKLIAEKSSPLPPVTTGSFSISTVPSKARIVFDGNKLSQKTPALIDNLAEGSYPVHISLRGYLDVQRVVEVKAGETTNLEIQLRKIEKPQPQAASEQLRYSIKTKFSIISGIMEDYNDWVDVVNEYVLEPDPSLKNLSDFGNLNNFEIQFAYYIKPQYEIGVTIGQIAGENYHDDMDIDRGGGWVHKFKLSNVFEGVTFYYHLVPSPSQLYGTVGIGFDIYQSTINVNNNVDFGEDEEKSELTASGSGFHAGLGVGYRFTPRFSVESNFNWRSATIEGYTGKIKYYSYGNLLGEEDAILFESYGNYYPAPTSWEGGDEGSVDMTGLEFVLGLVFSF